MNPENDIDKRAEDKKGTKNVPTKTITSDVGFVPFLAQNDEKIASFHSPSHAFGSPFDVSNKSFGRSNIMEKAILNNLVNSDPTQKGFDKISGFSNKHPRCPDEKDQMPSAQRSSSGITANFNEKDQSYIENFDDGDTSSIRSEDAL